MRKLDAGDLKELNLLKHYRIIRKWACKNNDLTDAELELLIYLDSIDYFTKKDFRIILNNFKVIKRNESIQCCLQFLQGVELIPLADHTLLDAMV